MKISNERLSGMVLGLLLAMLLAMLAVESGLRTSAEELTVSEAELASTYCQTYQPPSYDNLEHFVVKDSVSTQNGDVIANIGLVGSSTTWTPYYVTNNEYGYASKLQVSPDGNFVAFDNRISEDFLIVDAQGEATIIDYFWPNYSRAAYPEWITWSADSSQLAFLAGDKLLVSDLNGRIIPVNVDSDWVPIGPSLWSDSGTLYFSAINEQSHKVAVLEAFKDHPIGFKSEPLVVMSNDHDPIMLVNLLLGDGLVFRTSQQQFAYVNTDGWKVYDMTRQCQRIEA